MNLWAFTPEVFTGLEQAFRRFPPRSLPAESDEALPAGGGGGHRFRPGPGAGRFPPRAGGAGSPTRRTVRGWSPNLRNWCGGASTPLACGRDRRAVSGPGTRRLRGEASEDGTAVSAGAHSMPWELEGDGPLGSRRYLLQRLNPLVFPDGPAVHRNIVTVTESLRCAASDEGVVDLDRRVLRLARLPDGAPAGWPPTAPGGACCSSSSTSLSSPR